MKKSLFLVPFMAALALAGCSKDEPLNNEGFDESFDGQAFMRVRISMSDGTRAASDFVDGTAEEQAINEIGLKFYNSDGSFYGYGMPVENPEIVESTDVDNNIDAKVKDAVIVLQINSNAPKPTHVVAYANCKDGWKLTPEPGIDVITGEMAGYYNKYDVPVAGSADGATQETKYFAMTSSNYRNVTSGSADFFPGYKTVIKPSQFKATEEEAKIENVPVDIYVERLAAKVKVSPAADMPNAEITSGDYTLKFVIDGYALGATEPTSYYIKNVDSRWDQDALWAGWNDASLHRCFWAADVHYFDKNVVPPLKFVKYNEARTTLTQSMEADQWLYSTENTQASFGTPNTPQDVTAAPRYTSADVNRYQFQEFVYVIGHYEVTKNGVEVKPADPTDLTAKDQYLFEYAGKIFPYDVMLTYLEQNLSNVIYEKHENGDKAATYTAVSLSSLGWLEIGQYENDASLVCLKLKSTVTDTMAQQYYLKVETPAGSDKADADFVQVASTADITERLKQSSIQAYGFKYDPNCANTGKGGYLAYFPVLIKHLNTDGSNPLNTGEDARGYYGVVRNHCYNITINKISGLGIGIYNPDVDIIPKDKIKPLYLASTIKVLTWRVVNQNVDL